MVSVVHLSPSGQALFVGHDNVAAKFTICWVG